MMTYANLYKFLILIVFIKSNFACTYEKRYDETEVKPQVQNVTKTRTVCCKGYIRNKEEHNKVICYPECKNCIKGYCLEPRKCICNDGYMGENCTEICADGKWGTNCLGTCNCINGAQCDHRTGHCICAIGWTGENCEQSTKKDRINATNWVRVDDGHEHDKILKNSSSVQTKFIEDVAVFHKTVSVVKTSKQVDGELHQDGKSVVLEKPIVPDRLETDDTDTKGGINFNQLYPPLLIGISVLLIILTIILTFKIRNSISSIRKIQQNPAKHFRKKLNNEPASIEQHIIAHPTPINIAPAVPSSLQIEKQKKSLKPQQRQLPEVPPQCNIYDIAGTKKHNEPSTPTQQPTQPKTSPISDEPVDSFIHKRNSGNSYLFMGKKNMGPVGNLKPKTEKASPVQSEEFYETIKPQPEPEAQYESVGFYDVAK